MKTLILTGILTLAAGYSLMAQLTPKSQEEAKAVQAMFTAQTPDEAIKAAEELLS
jgi:hypothetical protein